MILVDTSIWIDYIRAGRHDRLGDLLESEGVVMHDYVFGEIAMGSPKNRAAILDMLRNLHRIPTASHFEVMTFVESAKLYGLGLNYIDVHLLAAAQASSDKELVWLWTRDTELLKQAGRFGFAYQP